MKTGGIDASGIEAMLAQLKSATQRPQANALGELAMGADIGNKGAQGVSKSSFADALKASLNQVNKAQLDAEKLGKDFVMGDDNLSLSDVMIAGQKANISFQATVQVRNKLVSAYHDIMNMQV